MRENGGNPKPIHGLLALLLPPLEGFAGLLKACLQLLPALTAGEHLVLFRPVFMSPAPRHFT